MSLATSHSNSTKIAFSFEILFQVSWNKLLLRQQYFVTTVKPGEGMERCKE